jgi:lysyl-tRNA synthetase class 1
LLKDRGNGPFLIASGISPSGRIHVGNLREVLTADIIHRVLRERGVKTRFVFIADDYDALRKVYPFLDEAVYAKYVGCPLSEIPAPSGEDISYADYFLRPFATSLKELKIDAEIIRASELYKTGVLEEQCVQALQNRDWISEILNRVTGKDIPESWSPFIPQCGECGSMSTTALAGWNGETREITYTCAKCDTGEHTVPITGNGKLTWRVDWPARWAALKVDIEPFGKDHGGKGGSYDTGKEIVKDIFGWHAPFPIIYEWIRLKGLGDMSSSKGNVVAIEDVLEVVPPDVLRYFITRPAPKASLALDLVTQLLNLVDEVDDDTKKQRDARAVELSQAGGFVPIGIPFNHLINVYQVAQGDVEKVKEILTRTGYHWGNDDALVERCRYADCWLKRFAPEEYKFHVTERIPDSVQELSDEQKTALAQVAERLAAAPTSDGDAIHHMIYETANATGTGMGNVCKAFYQALIGKDRGPRAGWFAAMIGTEFVSKRLKEAAEQ